MARGRRESGLARTSGRHGPAGLARRAGTHPARAAGTRDLPGEAGPEQRRSQRLWGRIAAKEAARRLWNDAGGPPTYPADLAIVADEHGRPLLTRLGEPAGMTACRPSRSPMPTGRRRPGRARSGRPGGYRRRTDRRTPAELSDATAFTAGERSLLDRWTGPSRTEWVARFWCAKEAAAKASGLGFAGGPASAEIVDGSTMIPVCSMSASRPRLRGSLAGRFAMIPCASCRPGAASAPGPGPLEKESKRDFRAFQNRDP